MKNEVYEVSDWSELNYYNSWGTRSKKILANPSGDIYYFKESYNNGKGKHYKYEFYSEIIASFIGEMSGLDILDYSIAIHKENIGCLSKSRISNDEELIEGGKYLKAFDNTFIMDQEKPKEKYTFQLIMNAFKSFSLESNIDKLIDIIIFDAIIGNSDRHQENWGFIAKSTSFSNAFSEVEKTIAGQTSKYENLINNITRIFNLQKIIKQITPHEISRIKLTLKREIRFAPIYDSGCSLGRELTEDRANNVLSDIESLDAYISKGQAEIYWDGIKYKHFDLLKLLFETDAKIKERAKEVAAKVNIDSLQEFVYALDQKLPVKFEQYKIPKYRKDLVVKLIT